MGSLLPPPTTAQCWPQTQLEMGLLPQPLSPLQMIVSNGLNCLHFSVSGCELCGFFYSNAVPASNCWHRLWSVDSEFTYYILGLDIL